MIIFNFLQNGDSSQLTKNLFVALFLPGNILVSGKYPKLKLNLLDCGLVVEMGPEQHRNVVKVLGAFTRKDGRLAGQLMVDMNSESQASPRDVELFVSGIEQICVMDSDQVRTRCIYYMFRGWMYMYVQYLRVLSARFDFV